jgi:hypothetical protein
MELNFGIYKQTVYIVEFGDVDLRHIKIENNDDDQYYVFSYGEEIDVFNYSGNDPFDAINKYLNTYAIENGYA